jgi:hypothetical protein
MNTTDSGLLYKYRSWGEPFHPECLLKNQLYFSSPMDMNDPFDFKIPPNFALLDTEELMLLYFNEGITKFTGQQISKMGGRDELKRKMFHSFKTQLPQVQKDFEKKFFPTIDKHFGVICLSHRWDSVLMWSHYSDNHKGFCLGLDQNKLLETCEFGSQGKVVYDEFPNVSPLTAVEPETIIKQSYFKAPGWAYEEEFRIIKLEYPAELSHEERIHIYPDGCLKEIILGLRISDADKSEIRKVGFERNIPVYQMEKIPLSFNLERRLISANE